MEVKPKNNYSIPMTDSRLDAIISNEKEWRRELLKRVDSLNTDFQNYKLETTRDNAAFKVKFSFIGAFSGFIGGAMVALGFKFIK